MGSSNFHIESPMPRPAGDVFRWHEKPGVLERLTPPWEKIEILREAQGLSNGQRVLLRQKVGPFRVTWEVEHQGYDESRAFRDVAIRCPFATWEHQHRFVSDGAASSTLIDDIVYRLPGGGLGELLAGSWVRRKLERLFEFRHERTLQDLKATARYGAVRPMRFLISGASGLVGRALVPFLRSQGHEVVCLVRRPSGGEHEVAWDPSTGELDYHQLKGIDAVIHLAGAPIAERRWSKAVRDEIWNSRIQGARTLIAALDKMRHRPFVFVSASGTGIYGSRGGDTLDESSERGTGFLADVCAGWEREAEAVEALGIRPVSLRTGMVLSPAGGALARLLPLYRLGLGGRLGGGGQWMSWIGIDDLVGAYYHAVLDQRCIHAVNAVAPFPVTNRDFAETLARVLRRPTLLPVPPPVLRLSLGHMADELLLSSARVTPRILQDSGYRFRHSKLEDALRFVLGAKAARTTEEAEAPESEARPAGRAS
ncbi:TIGR01777 family protein [Opitutaceae bacterium EW11]|nr:TIGR01777 family protein [Opitutaceae bacterium EW11]